MIKPEIKEVVSRHTSLRSVGKNLSGLCPFHSERHPSFFVNPRTGRYRCYGCGVSGDSIQFVMDYHKLSFKKALKYLGIPSDKPNQRKIKKKELIKAFRQWCDSYCLQLIDLYRNLQDAKLRARCIEVVELLAPYYHQENLWLNHIDTLQNGNSEEKFRLYREVKNGN